MIESSSCYYPLNDRLDEIRVVEILQDHSGSLLAKPFGSAVVCCKLHHVSIGPQSYHTDYGVFKTAYVQEQRNEWNDMFSRDVDDRERNIESQTFQDNHVHHDTNNESSRFSWGDFEALSYTWGQSNERLRISLNGKIIDVPKNVAQALQRLSDLPETKAGMRYWIDALCINQDDIEERDTQVKRMQSIYDRARAVLVWLGESTNMDREALGFIRSLHGLALQEPDEPIHFLYNQEPRTLHAMASFLNKPYWHRLWIVQELASNHHSTAIMCGEFMVTRRMLRVASSFWQRHYETTLLILRDRDHPFYESSSKGWLSAYRVHRLLSTFPERSSSRDLHHLLNIARRAKAKEEKDKVYGILGLVNQKISEQIVPKYASETVSAFRDFVRAIVDTMEDLDVLFCWSNPPGSSKLPSWIPDWTTTFERNHIQYLRIRKAGTLKRAEYRYLGRDRMRCKGIIVDLVEGLSYHPSGDVVHGRCLLSRYSSAPALREAILATMIMGHPGVRRGIPGMGLGWFPGYSSEPEIDKHALRTYSLTHYEQWDLFKRNNKHMILFGKSLREHLSIHVGQGLSDHDDSKIAHNIRLASVSITGRRLMTSVTGFVGIVPNATAAGDIVAIIYGCHFPVILRKAGNAYRVIGECYVHGLMEGEIFGLQGVQRDVDIELL